jgi:hypothetical protein
MDLSDPPEGGKPKRDYPITLKWQPDSLDAFDVLGLPPPKSKRFAFARCGILAEALVVNRVRPEEYLSYSRRRPFYSARRYYPNYYRYSTVVPAVDQFERCGLIEHDRAPPGSYGKRQSRFRLVPEVVELMTKAAPPLFIPSLRETIILRDREESRLIIGTIA